MIKVKTNTQIHEIENKTIRILKDILNDAIANKKVTKAIQKKGYKLKEVASPHAFIMRRLQHIK